MGRADSFRFPIRVRPGASRERVGGEYGDPPELVVAVGAQAVDGAANTAVIKVLAQAFGVPRSAVELVQGATSRTKIVAVVGDSKAVSARLAELLDGAPR